jgi:hypothetical protein
MLDILFRLLAAVVGVQGVYGAMLHWFALAEREAQRGFAATDAFGRANLRADVGGIFLAIGLFALIAAWRRSPQWALAAVLALACAICGRLVSGMFDGFAAREINAIVSELVGVGVLLQCWWRWHSKSPEGL